METKYDITASIVLYHSSYLEIKTVLNCFLDTTLKVRIYLIDNSKNDQLSSLGQIDPRIEYIFNHKNLGYGSAHNIAIKKSILVSHYHLVLNPDIIFEPAMLYQALQVMTSRPEIGLLSPQIFFPNGQRQYMCRLLPSPFDLILRRFIPKFISKVFVTAMDEYLLKDLDYNNEQNIPNLPGSFMFLRNEAIVKSGGFDEKYFMYLEDVDLTRRINKYYQTLYYPKIKILHKLDQGSYKSLKLLKYHIQSAFIYFNKWGWYKDGDRKKINKSILSGIKNVKISNHQSN